MTEEKKDDDKKPKEYHFFVDNKQYNTVETTLNGAQIKALASVPGNYQLFLEEPGTGADRAISDGDSLTMTPPPKHFYAVPPATFGAL